MKLKRFTTHLAAAGLIALPLMANAAGLGKLSVTSALGQPLAAEIELFAADKAELDSLTASLASDQAFREARVDFAPVLSSLRFTVEKKPNGKAVLKVTSTRPVTDPFIDMLVELNWASGRLVREYTMLLDPPGMAAPQTVAPVAVVTPPAQPKAAAAPTPAPAPAVQPVAPAAPKVAAPAPRPAPKPAAPESVQVKRGDTLRGIAGRVRPEGVSLEQTLIGLYRENPSAFDGNVNRLRAGKTLAVPSANAIAAVPQQEAVRELRLQAEDWRAYRQKLAAAATTAPEAQAAPGQAASGKITPKVEDRAKPAPEAQKDVVKLSKSTPAAGTSAKADEARALQEKLRAQEEDAIAREKALQESSQRVAMLEKQIQEMQKLVEMKEQAEAAAAAPAAPVAPAAPAQPAPKPAAPVVSAPPAAAEPTANWYDPLVANPMYWGGGLAALGLGGVLWWMMAGSRRRKQPGTALEDSIMSGGDVRPSAIMGGAASGGSVNTGDTSFLTDFSQAGLGTIDTHDVDPIAEAEVYMAYGRDAQAEEILKEAVGKNPDRHEIRVKLLEIYASRHDTKSFEAVAGELFAALGTESSPHWEKVCEMGRGIDPTNPLYGGRKADAAPSAEAATVAATAAVAGGAVTFADDEPEAAAAEESSASADESELEPLREIDFDLPTEPVETAPAASDAAGEPAESFAEPEEVTPAAIEAQDSNVLEFESPGQVLNFDTEPAEEQKPAETAYTEPTTQGLDFELPELEVPAAEEPLSLDLGLEAPTEGDSKFDFSGLDLDLGEADEGELDEVGTKLDLARAYVEMGDNEGAREILNEVLAEGSDKQKADAKGMLSALG